MWDATVRTILSGHCAKYKDLFLELAASERRERENPWESSSCLYIGNFWIFKIGPNNKLFLLYISKIGGGQSGVDLPVEERYFACVFPSFCYTKIKKDLYRCGG